MLRGSYNSFISNIQGPANESKPEQQTDSFDVAVRFHQGLAIVLFRRAIAKVK
jgi:hypothetical protein